MRADVLTEDNGRSKGCGIVVFDRAEDANNAISILCIELLTWLPQIF